MRHTGSRITGCSFKLTLTRTVIGWQVEVQNPDHNYKALTHPGALPHYRHRTQETNQTITNITASSITPSKILTNLLKKDIIITLNNIYNEQQANKKELLSGLSAIQALLKALGKYSNNNNPKLKYYFVHKEDDRNYIKYLFFVHPESLKYFQKNPDVLLLNYTYKINRFKMPFLYTVGVSSTGQNFELTYYFLLGETEADYNFTI